MLSFWTVFVALKGNRLTPKKIIFCNRIKIPPPPPLWGSNINTITVYNHSWSKSVPYKGHNNCPKCKQIIYPLNPSELFKVNKFINHRSAKQEYQSNFQHVPSKMVDDRSTCTGKSCKDLYQPRADK